MEKCKYFSPNRRGDNRNRHCDMTKFSDNFCFASNQETLLKFGAKNVALLVLRLSLRACVVSFFPVISQQKTTVQVEEGSQRYVEGNLNSYCCNVLDMLFTIPF